MFEDVKAAVSSIKMKKNTSVQKIVSSGYTRVPYGANRVLEKNPEEIDAFRRLRDEIGRKRTGATGVPSQECVINRERIGPGNVANARRDFKDPEEIESFRRLREEIGRKRDERIQMKQEHGEDHVKYWNDQRDSLFHAQETLQQELERERELRQTAEQRANNFKDQHQQDQQRITELTTTLTRTQEELRQERTQKQRVEQRGTLLERQHQQDQQRIAEMSNSVTTVQQELVSERERRTTAEQRATDLENQHRESIAELTSSLRSTQQEMEDERNQRQVNEQQVRDLESRLQDQDLQVNDLTATAARTEQALEQERTENQRTQQQLQVEQRRINELTTSLTTAQRAIEEYRRSESRDWVINRAEVSISNKRLGKGGWGEVVEGTFRGTEVAVKRIHELILSERNRRLFEREMNMASRCRHPHLLQFIGATNDNGSPLFLTELMETSLRNLLDERPLACRESLVISTDVARALNYLHLHRPTAIIHRDISSANVLLWRQGENWRGKVSDYGAANFVRQEMTIAPGAPPYSAPEALTSTQSPKLDVYSFGVLLCEMCTRQAPIPDQREQQIVLVNNQELGDLIRRCVLQDPDARPSMEEILHELQSCDLEKDRRTILI